MKSAKHHFGLRTLVRGGVAAALALGALLLVTCGTEEETGIRLLIQAEDLDAPTDFDALSLHVSSGVFADYSRPYDLLHPELADHRDSLHDNRIVFPLDLLILADAPGGTEIAIEILGFLCGDGAAPRSEALGWSELKACVTDGTRQVATSGPEHPRLKLVAGRVREITVTLHRVHGDCEDADGDGYGTGSGCLGPDCDDGDHQVHPGATEVCDDEQDNDCDGITDEDCGCSVNDPPRSCFTGPPAACPALGCVGQCRLGEQRCESGTWSVTCYGEVLPTAESCDGQDNDCDRDTDEGDPLDLCGDPLPAHADPVCAEGICRIERCHDGYVDANNDYSDGCEAEDGCGGQGECSAGEVGTEERDCTRCGKEARTRTCSDTCQWGAWSDWGACSGQGECEGGEVQDDGCGNCNTGTRSRTCSASCEWGDWSSCTGAAPCASGETQEQSGCSDCGTGTRSRTCGSDCQWEDWGACSACSWEQGYNWRYCTGGQCTTPPDCWQYCSSQCSWYSCQNMP